MENKKRPRGLKKAMTDSKNKRAKVKTDAPPPAAVEAPEVSDEATIALEGAEDGDEVSELKSMYEIAFAKQGKGERDEALMLFRGVIHECDKLLRQRDGALPESAQSDSSSTETTTTKPSTSFPSKFYLVYSNALERLGLLADTDEAASEEWPKYLEAAAERLQWGLENATEQGGDGDDTWQLKLNLGRLQFLQASTLIPTPETSIEIEPNTQKLLTSLLTSGKSHIQSALSSLPSETSSTTADLLEAASAVQRHADVRRDWESRNEWNTFAEELFGKILKDDESNQDALAGLGSCHLSRANYYLELQDEDSSDVDDQALKKHLDQALTHLRQSQTTSTDHVPTLVLLGETLINLGNLADTSASSDNDEEEEKEEQEEENEEATKHYKEAFECLHKVQSIDPEALPPQFEEFVAEWEQDL
ncbi:hypothetical protein HDV00_007206 [Rhizophlyctis rosea]|nr:hypothetical protein HDV00_007206 [Rhizophlyctis rosea]